MEILVSLLSGAVGGNIAGALMKDKSLGTLWNSVVGILGGGIGGQILGLVGLGDASGIIALSPVLALVAQFCWPS